MCRSLGRVALLLALAGPGAAGACVTTVDVDSVVHPITVDVLASALNVGFGTALRRADSAR